MIKASTVLSGALEFWGQGGEQWIQHEIGDSSQACLVGGLTKPLVGYPVYLDELYEDTHVDAYKKAMKYIWDEIYKETDEAYEPRDEHDLEDRLVTYNDHSGREFDEVRNVVCKALKRALNDEEKQDAVTK